MKRRGRLLEKDKRNQHVAILFTKAERRLVTRHARKAKKTLSTFIRDVVLSAIADMPKGEHNEIPR